MTSPSQQSPGRRSRWLHWFAAAAIVAAAVAVYLGSRPVGTHDRRLAEISNDHQDEFDRPKATSPGYIGPQACAECHRDRVAEFKLTNHYRACRKPDSDEMPAGFEPGPQNVAWQKRGVRFEMTRSGEDFHQTTIVAAPDGDVSTSSRIDLIYGSAPNDEIYLTWQRGGLYELPVAWLHPKGEWGISQYDPNGKGDFSRPLTVRCLECHNTWFEHTPGTLNEYQRDHHILGVTCERCHGPGQEHATYHQNHPAENSGQLIVHPGRLSRDRLMDVCAQCHSNSIKHRGPAFSYRPGQPLEASYKTIGSEHPENDHVANQTKYLRQSKCYQKSETLTCITCHDPHKSAAATHREQTSSTHSCLNCHSAIDCDEHNRLPLGVRDNCIGCHMPTRNKIQVYFETAEDAYVPPVKAYEHRIGIYPIARKEVLLEWYQSQSDDASRRSAAELTDELVEYWLGEGDRRHKSYRHLAAIDAFRKALRLKESPEIRQKLRMSLSDREAIDEKWFVAARQIGGQQYSEAATTLEQILLLKPDLAKVHGKLGTVYAALGEKDRALEHLKSVVKFDPDDPYGEGMIGWLDFLDGRYASAAEHYRRADEIEPYKAKIHYQWGLAFAKQRSWEPAAERFRQALTIDPNHSDACVNLSQVLRQDGKLEDAIQFADRAAKISRRKNPEVLLYLAECLAEGGRVEEAHRAAMDSLAAAQDQRPDLLPRIRRHLDEYRKAGRKP